jgi:hypothetical protein
MPTRQQLANPSTTQLAVMCGKDADDPAHYGELNAERAAEFKSQWVSLQTTINARLGLSLFSKGSIIIDIQA